MAAAQAGAVMTTSGIEILASPSIFHPSLEADTLRVAGGMGARAADLDSELINALTTLCNRVTRIASICTGLFPLAATGLL